MPLVSADEIHAHVETDRTPEAIALLVADAEAAIMAAYGPHPPEPIVLERPGIDGVATLFLDRPAASVTSVSEYDGDSLVATELEPGDYRLRYGGRAVQRLGSGENPRAGWAGRVVLTFVPVDDTARRKRVVIDLVRLALRYEAAKAQTAGDRSETALDDYTRERENLLGELADAVAFS